MKGQLHTIQDMGNWVKNLYDKIMILDIELY